MSESLAEDSLCGRHGKADEADEGLSAVCQKSLQPSTTNLCESIYSLSLSAAGM